MPKTYKPLKRRKLPLDLAGLSEGRYATICEMAIPPSGHAITLEILHAKVQQIAKDLLNACPDRVPVDIIIDWQSDIRFRATVMALPQGALQLTNGENGPVSHQNLEDSALSEAEDIAAAARQMSQPAIDIGNVMATEAEKRSIYLDEVDQTMARSTDEFVSRSTYARARSTEAKIHFSDGKLRTIGGNKVIPATTHSRETFELKQCNLKIIKSDSLELSSVLANTDWRQLQSSYPGLTLVKGEADSPIHNSLLIAAKAGIRVDMTVAITEKIATGGRWCSAISIQNKDELFDQSREWLEFLQESLTP